MKLLIGLLVAVGLQAQFFPFPGPGTPSQAVVSGITFDATSISGFATTTVSWSHTTSGSNGIMWIGVYCDTDTATAPTYNSVSATFVKKQSMPGGSANTIYLYYLVAPATGTHTVTINSSGTSSVQGFATSFTGAKQTGVPDASVSNSASAVTGGTDFTTTLTTVADNTWAVLIACSHFNVPGASTGSTLRNSSATFDIAFFDTNGALTPAGSKSMSVKGAATADWGTVMASFAPVP